MKDLVQASISFQRTDAVDQFGCDYQAPIDRLRNAVPEDGRDRDMLPAQGIDSCSPGVDLFVYQYLDKHCKTPCCLSSIAERNAFAVCAALTPRRSYRTSSGFQSFTTPQ